MRGLVFSNINRATIHCKVEDAQFSHKGKPLCEDLKDTLYTSTNPRRVTCKHCLELMKASKAFCECPNCGLLCNGEFVTVNSKKHCVICDSQVIKFK